MRSLAEKAGRARSVLTRWSSEDKWVEQRDRFQAEMRSKTQEKFIEKQSDRVAQEWVSRNQEHLRTYELGRKTVSREKESIVWKG